MSATTARSAKRRWASPGGRRGAMTLLLLFMLVVLTGIGSLALNLAWLRCHRIQLHKACEAAALAGASQLLDPSPSDTSHAASAAAAARVALATRQARTFFAPNTLATLRTDGPDGDVIAGWCADPTSPGAAVARWTGPGPVNSLTVRGARRRSSGQAVIVWFGSFFGVSNAEPADAARASMDQRIAGFHPLSYVNVPMVPLLVFSTNQWPSAAVGTAEGSQDNYSVDSRTETVSPAQDGVGEITLQIPLAGSSLPAGQHGGCWLSLPSGTTDFSLLGRQVSGGLGPSDLAGVGGEFVLGQDGRLPLLAAPRPDAGQAAALQTALLAIRGRKRIWPVGDLAAGGDAPSCRVTGFVAGCVVDCRLDDDCLAVVIQSCTMQTCTGVLRNETARNPWIGKLILNE
jgi:hypothetical protein